MANLDFDLGVLERQLHQARQNAIQAELAAAGLQEIGHPMLLCVLGVTGERRPGTPVRTQRELARLLHVSPAAVTTSLKSPGSQAMGTPGATGCCSPKRGSRRWTTAWPACGGYPGGCTPVSPTRSRP